MQTLQKFFLTIIALLILASLNNYVFAQTSPSVLYVPLIGITSVPDPLALPRGAGSVTYNYAVKNFLSEVDVTNVQVVDNKCSPVTFVEGDDNADARLNYTETWRYACTTNISATVESIATATGISNGMPATDTAYATVVVGSNNQPPLVSVINITKVAYPLSLPAKGGSITFTYRVNNPGLVPLTNVTVTDDKCTAMSGKLGDTNGNNLLDINEVWIYTCTANLTKTTTNTVTVEAFANGLKTTDTYTLTVKVATVGSQPLAGFPDTGENVDFKTMVWAILLGFLIGLILCYFLTKKTGKNI